VSLYISPVNALIVAVACCVGYLVYRQASGSHNGPRTASDLVLAFTAAVAVMTVLAFLFGVGPDQSPGSETSPPERTPASTAPPR
jgi:hypothetical protein